MRAIVVGVDSTIGGALYGALTARGAEVVGTTRRVDRAEAGGVRYLDLTDEVRHSKFQPADVAFICAAMTSFADCRNRPELARQVNFLAPALLAARLADAGVKVILLSTNAVFDCLEPAMLDGRPKAPISVYGRTKAAAEEAVLSPAVGGTVLRLTKVLTPEMPLLQRWIQALRRGQTIDAVDDARIAPLLVRHVVDALISICRVGERRVYQVSASHDVSYFELGLRLADRLSAGRSLVLPRSAIDMGIPREEVMRYTSLDTTGLSALTGMSPPHPYVAIDECISANVQA